MREERCDMMVEGCSGLLLLHPSTPEAQSESHGWHRGCHDKQWKNRKTMKCYKIKYAKEENSL